MVKIIQLKKYFMDINYNKIEHLELLKKKSVIANSEVEFKNSVEKIYLKIQKYLNEE